MLHHWQTRKYNLNYNDVFLQIHVLPVVVYLDNFSSVVSATTRVMLNRMTSGKIFFLNSCKFYKV